jgi:hypothetical protein
MTILIIAIIIFILVASEISHIVVYGGYIKNVDKYMDLNGYYLNSYDSTILSHGGKKPYIASTKIGILCKYYISGKGMVFRWSKLHKKIKQHYLITESKTT